MPLSLFGLVVRTIRVNRSCDGLWNTCCAFSVTVLPTDGSFLDSYYEIWWSWANIPSRGHF